jgi:RimJ/RimL family protein N-acetyltransferase
MMYVRFLWADAATMELVGGPVHFTENQSAEWFRKMIDPGDMHNCYRLICDEDGLPVGEISYHRLDLDSMTAEFNVKIEARFRGRGFARSAMREFLSEYFMHLGGHALNDDVAASNLAGQRLLESFGFDPTLESQLWRRFTMTRERFLMLYPQTHPPRDKAAGSLHVR